MILLYWEAAICLILAKLVIRFVPTKHWLHYLGEKTLETAFEKPTPASQEKAKLIQKALWGALYRLPGTYRRFNCLVQVLAGIWMLRRRGLPYTSHIGVKQNEKATEIKKIYAHAWLQSGEQMITDPFPQRRQLQEIARFSKED